MSSLTSVSLPNLPTQSPAPRPAARTAAAPVPAPPPECLHGPVEDLGPWGRRALVGGVALAHLAAAWALAQGRAPEAPPPPPAPIAVQWIALPAPAPAPAAPPPPAPAPRPTPRPPAAAPIVTAAARPEAAPALAPAPTPVAEATPPQTAPRAAPVAAPAPPAPQPAAAPAGPVALPASALRYVTMPRLVYPAAARRLGETGTALVRVVVDVNGLPREVTLHQSSGHVRLDEAALDAMRAARFQPYHVEGRAVEAVAIAPLAFQLR